ncbi:Flagellar L-ring protein FlgH [hydrothermal vent metagenome]|uniref:Flagellar L-ring protein FlgH n=1 Tax=hydrothermal vent metagenome TaxID=652676 RepID=A0A1W1BQS3_9ZZZZ
MLLSLSGCTANLTDPEINFKPPAYVEQMPAKEQRQDFTATGSIFGQGENPLFSDHKAMHVNDIVTVVISETAKSSNTGTKQLSNVGNSKLGGALFSKSGIAMQGVNSYTNLGLQTGSTTNFKGSGTAVKDASFTTTVSARVVKVLKNGNYFISGRREILIDNQKQLVQISGVIRPYDIDQNNKINSSQISDAKILYKTEGDVERATEQPWGTKILQAIWPF